MLTAEQLTVMKRVLDEEEARREHVIHLSGAHAYGFPSPDSDLDLKAIHIANTADLLGFEPPAPTIDRAEIIDSVEVDYTSNELAHALVGNSPCRCVRSCSVRGLALLPVGRCTRNARPPNAASDVAANEGQGSCCAHRVQQTTQASVRRRGDAPRD
jgi:hypothetical protein